MVNDTQSFTAKPRPVQPGGKKMFRDEGGDEEEEGHYYANIHFDKRVHRGSNYSTLALNNQAIIGGPPASRPKRRKPKPPEKSPFALPLPKQERLPVDLTSFLVEQTEEKFHNTEETQTDAFKPRPVDDVSYNLNQGKYIPKRTGVDAATHIEEAELFKFDKEVEPLLNVLTNKTIEQALEEIEEELEMTEMRKYKDAWMKTRIKEHQEELTYVIAEKKRYAATQKILAEKWAERSDEVKRKVLSAYAGRKYLSNLLQNSIETLRTDYGIFPNPEYKAVALDFMPTVLAAAQEGLKKQQRNKVVVNKAVETVKMEKFIENKKGLAVHQEIAEKRYLEYLEKKFPKPEEPVVEEEAPPEGGEGEEGGEGGDGEAAEGEGEAADGEAAAEGEAAA